MKTAIRRPKMHKPSKGMKNFFKQQKKSLIKALTGFKGKNFHNEQWWHTAKAMRSQWLTSHSRSKYKPHQGAQEKARRIIQMQRWGESQVDAGDF